jgi:hypothetical protein
VSRTFGGLQQPHDCPGSAEKAASAVLFDPDMSDNTLLRPSQQDVASLRYCLILLQGLQLLVVAGWLTVECLSWSLECLRGWCQAPPLES